MATKDKTETVQEVVYIPLKAFADSNALKYSIELMGGFYHEQELKKHYADSEDNWHQLMMEFSKREVK